MPRGGSATTFKEFVDQEVKNAATKGGLVLGGAALAEAETGAAQEAVDIASKSLYNEIKQKDLFQTPKGLKEIVGQIVYSAAQEMVGGLVLGTMPAVSAAVNTNDFSSLTPEQIKIFREIKDDPTISSTGLNNLIKIKINQGDLTVEEGKKLKADYNEAIALARDSSRRSF